MTIWNQLAGIFSVPAIAKAFENTAEALKYSMTCQNNRRNITRLEFKEYIKSVMPYLAKNGINQYKKEGLPNGEPPITHQDLSEATGRPLRTIDRELSRQREEINPKP